MTTSIPHPVSSQATAEAVLDRMFGLRALRLSEYDELASKKIKRQASEARWRPWREELRQWLNLEWENLEAQWRALCGTSPEPREDIQWAEAVRTEARHLERVRRPASEERLAVELRDLARHAQGVRDVDHIMWLDPWVDRWALALAGDPGAEQIIATLRAELGKYRAAHAARIENRHQANRIHEEQCRVLAGAIWKNVPTLNIEDMIDHPEIHAYLKDKMPGYTRNTLRRWIGDLCPNPHPGRPRNATRK